MKRLPRTKSALRRLLPGRESAWLRSMVGRTAEMLADKDLGPAAVLEGIVEKHGARLSKHQLIEIGRGLERDIEVVVAGAVVDLGGAA